MNREKAVMIAEDFLRTMNPSNWNGLGERPDSFNTLIKTYDIQSDDNELDISFEYDHQEKTWEHYCELRDKQSEGLIMPLHGYGIDSIDNLADTILDVCLSVSQTTRENKNYMVFVLGYDLLHDVFMASDMKGCDTAFEKCVKIYERFLTSEYNDKNKSEYECLSDFVSSEMTDIEDYILCNF